MTVTLVATPAIAVTAAQAVTFRATLTVTLTVTVTVILVVTLLATPTVTWSELRCVAAGGAGHPAPPDSFLQLATDDQLVSGLVVAGLHRTEVDPVRRQPTALVSSIPGQTVHAGGSLRVQDRPHDST